MFWADHHQQICLPSGGVSNWSNPLCSCWQHLCQSHIHKLTPRAGWGSLGSQQLSSLWSHLQRYTYQRDSPLETADLWSLWKLLWFLWSLLARSFCSLSLRDTHISLVPRLHQLAYSAWSSLVLKYLHIHTYATWFSDPGPTPGMTVNFTQPILSNPVAGTQAHAPFVPWSHSHCWQSDLHIYTYVHTYTCIYMHPAKLLEIVFNKKTGQAHVDQSCGTAKGTN